MYVALNGYVSERCWDGSYWFTGAFSQYGTSTSSIAWFGPSGGIKIRVYVSNGSNIQEWCCDPGWCWGAGSFSYPGTSSSATIWTTPFEGLRVYVNNGSNSITERCYDGNGWYTGGYY